MPAAVLAATDMTAFSLRHAADPLRPPEAPGLGRGFAFAIFAHALLVLALSAGVNWRTKSLPTFEAELWSAVPQAAAPKEVAPPPEPEAKPEPKPPRPAQPPAEDLQAQREAEIAIAKAREQKLKREAELEAERKKQQALKEKQAKQEQLEKRAAEEKLQQQKLEKQKQLDKQQLKDDEARREALRKENLRRIQGMAGASGAPEARGTALQSSGPSASYGGRIKARIRPNIIYSDSAAGNPVAEVEVRAAPDGRIIASKLLKPSGDAEWDKAVLRAIDKTEMLPRDVDGRVPSLLVITVQPRE